VVLLVHLKCGDASSHPRSTEYENRVWFMSICNKDL
jgi:hypothetical protein